MKRFYALLLNVVIYLFEIMSFFNSSGSFSRNTLNRSPLSPFCTSPSQLEELTLSQDATLSTSVGLRSPNSPMRGRTVKEIEEQISSLKKENFHLKLRIYFLEEKIGFNFTLDKDNILRKHVELQVEVTNLSKEVKEKHDLLCQAVKAMEVAEDEHKKFSHHKAEQILQLEQELEDLRFQLQEHNFTGNLTSPKSCMSSRQSDLDHRYLNEFVSEFHTKEKRYADDTDLSIKEQRDNHSANFLYDRTDNNIRYQIDILQKENNNKDQTIDRLNKQLSSGNEQLIDYAQQVKEYEEKLTEQHNKIKGLLVKLQEEENIKEKLKGQLAAIHQKLSMEKFEFEHQVKEIQREKKAVERANMMLDMRVSVLDSETRKQKEIIRDLQGKLEAATAESRKNQNLAVSTGCNLNQSPSTTDESSLSASKSATANGAEKKSSLPFQVEHSTKPSKSPSKIQVSPTLDNKNLQNFEDLLMTNCETDDSILNAFNILKHDFANQKQIIIKLKSEQIKACEIIKSMIDSRNKADAEIAALKKQQEKNVNSSSSIQTRVSEMKLSAIGTSSSVEQKLSMPTDHRQSGEEIDDMDQYKELAIALEAKIEVLVETLKQKDSQMEYINTQYDEILKTLEEKENRIVDLEFEILTLNDCPSGKHDDRSLLEKGDSGSEKRSSFYKQELEEKNREIEKLNNELKKCTCYLQEIVNKELWEKNREIEKLHRKHENTSDLNQLKKELAVKDVQLKLLKEKISELGIDIKMPNDEAAVDLKDVNLSNINIQHIKTLQDKLASLTDEKKFFENRVKELECSAVLLKKLEIENAEITKQLQKSEKLRQELNEASSVVNNRLEELAIFLESLLKQKSVLGFLGLAKNRRLKEILSSSLDLSRSFSISLISDPEKSLAQLSNISTLLNGSVFQELSLAEDLEDVEEKTHFSIMPDNVSLTYESHLQRKVPENGQLANDEVIAALRDQLFKLQKELEVRDIELNRLNQQGNDTNKQSGVEQLSESEAEYDKLKIKTANNSVDKLKCDAHSDSEAWSEPDRMVSRARIGLNSSVPPSELNNKLENCESTEDEDFYSGLTPSKRRSALVELNQEVYRLQTELQNLQRNYDELNVQKQHYEEAMSNKDKETQDTINLFEVEKEKILKESQKYLHELKDAENRLIAAENKIHSLESEVVNKEQILRKEYEESVILKLKNAEEVFVKRIKDIEEKSEVERKSSEEKFKLIQKSKLEESEKFSKELADVKTMLRAYESTISSYKLKENQLNSSLNQYQNEISLFQQNLADIAEKYSVLKEENLKICDEKDTMEKEMRTFSIKEQELRNQIIEIQTSLSEVTEKYSVQINVLQKEKSKLELKISELENTNAELRNRIIKSQTRNFSTGLNATLPANMGLCKSPYRRQYSDQTCSSEEVNNEEFRMVNLNSTGRSQIVDVERIEANSSPDLGIESDHGRFSSLETNPNNAPRPLLRTIELTESMNNLFNNNAASSVADREHDCEKFNVLAQENNELKRKILRMKRALEETTTQLNLANQRKKQVEKTICHQIHKTSQVLRKARANLDSGSESEVVVRPHHQLHQT